MEQDVIAYMYPYSCSAKKANKLIQNNPRFKPQRLPTPENRHNRRLSVMTEPPDRSGTSSLDSMLYLELKFSDPPKTTRGLIFGSNPKCDIVLPFQDVSLIHFSLTFDDGKRPIITDLGSFNGTQVTYDGEGKGLRKCFQWIVGSHGALKEKECIVIEIKGAISFQIIVPKRDVTSATYIASVDRFLQGTPDSEALLKEFGLLNSETQYTPSNEKIHLRKRLGEGTFGTVTHVWNVSDGSEYAEKTPTKRAIQTHRFDPSLWKREARIMGQISHPHIVRLIEALSDPHPQLRLEYAPLGSLDGHEGISYNETLAIVHQCSSALVYLHEHSPSIVHRDVKPSNILVQNRSSDNIHVKLGDFGASNDNSPFMTFCGTEAYLAPEVKLQYYANNQEGNGYTMAVDVWSLGVVACELVHGIPAYQHDCGGNATPWCQIIVDWLQVKVQKKHSDLGKFLLDAMVVLSPESRFSAKDCYNWATDRLSRTEEVDSHTSPPASYPMEEKQTTVRYIAESYGGDQATIVGQPRAAVDAKPAISPHLVSPPAQPPRLLSPSLKMTQRMDEVFEMLSPSVARQHISGQADREAVDEMTQFKGYSDDPLHRFFVGSELASQLGIEASDSLASQFSPISVQQGQAGHIGTQTGSGSGLARSIAPRSEKEGQHLENEYPLTEGGSPMNLE